MRDLLFQIARGLFGLGGFGLLIMGFLDSSFLFVPLGNDLLMIALTAAHNARMPYYAAMATAGSILGVLLTDYLSRKGGEKGLKGRVSEQRLERVKDKVSRRAGWAIALAAILPPPFPLKPFIVAAAALQYPRRKLIAMVAGARAVRFTAEGALAIIYGEGILALAEADAVQYAIVALIIISIAGSAASLFVWFRN